MILKNKVSPFILFLIFINIKSQEVKIILNNFNPEEIKINDSVVIKHSDNFFLYEKKKCEKNLSLVISDQTFLIKDLPKEINFIVLDYIPNTKNDCYVVNQTINDVSQTFNIENIKKCLHIININLYDRYDKNSLPAVKISTNK